MEFGPIWTLRGPNLWARFPVLEVELDLAALPALSAEQIAALRERLTALVPAFACPPAAAADSAYLAEVFQQLALLLQFLAGSPVSFGMVKRTRQPHYFKIILEYEEEEPGKGSLTLARELLLAALHGQSCDVPARLSALRELLLAVRLGPSTAAIVKAAKSRNIPASRLNSGSLFQLGQAARQRRICTAETDRTGAIAEAIAQDKQLTRTLLRAVGVPVPEGRPVADAEDAWTAAQQLGLPVVVKPQYGNHGRGVATNLTTREQVVQAHAAACEESASILVETFAPGDDYRLLVIGDKLVAAALREAAHVIGDGRSTIAELVAEVNRDPRRSAGHATVLSSITIDAVSLAVLAEQGCTLESIPAAGQRVLIRRNANLSTGGTATDVTDRVHPDVAACAVEAARVVGLDIAGVDVVVCDIGQPLEPQRGAIVEVNAGPGLRMHLEPSHGQPRPVGAAIIDMLFPTGETGRIPLLAVTGARGTTTTTRLLAHCLRGTGQVVGMTCTDGTYIGERCIEKGDGSGPRSVRAVLLHPRVEAAVFETACGGLLREGLGFDQCDVAVVTNIGHGNHLGRGSIDTVEELADVKRVVVEAVAPAGAAVLNAAEPLVVDMARFCPGTTIYFSRAESCPVLAAHRQAGGRGVFVRDHTLMLAEGQSAKALLPLDQVPLMQHGQTTLSIENVLAATAALWWLRLPLDTLRAGLRSFTGDGCSANGQPAVTLGQHSSIISLDNPIQ